MQNIKKKKNTGLLSFTINVNPVNKIIARSV